CIITPGTCGLGRAHTSSLKDSRHHCPLPEPDAAARERLELTCGRTQSARSRPRHRGFGMWRSSAKAPESSDLRLLAIAWIDRLIRTSADQEATCFKRGIPRQAKIFAIDRDAGFKASPHGAPGILCGSEVRDGQRDLSRDAADRQRASHVVDAYRD